MYHGEDMFTVFMFFPFVVRSVFILVRVIVNPESILKDTTYKVDMHPRWEASSSRCTMHTYARECTIKKKIPSKRQEPISDFYIIAFFLNQHHTQS